MAQIGVKNTKRTGKRTKRPSRDPQEVTSPTSVPASRQIAQPICASYLDPDNSIWCPYWHGVTTDEERVQYDTALRRACLDWYMKHALEAFKRPRKPKQVRQLTPSRVSYLKACVLDEIEQIQQPTRLRVSHLKARTLRQLINQPKNRKHIIPPK